MNTKNLFLFFFALMLMSCAKSENNLLNYKPKNNNITAYVNQDEQDDYYFLPDNTKLTSNETNNIPQPNCTTKYKNIQYIKKIKTMPLDSWPSNYGSYLKIDDKIIFAQDHYIYLDGYKYKLNRPIIRELAIICKLAQPN